MSIVGMHLKDMGNKLASSILIEALVRNNEVIVPNGDFVIKENDSIYLISQLSNIYNFCKLSGKYPQKVKNVMIAGGGRITIYLVKLFT